MSYLALPGKLIPRPRQSPEGYGGNLSPSARPLPSTPLARVVGPPAAPHSRRSRSRLAYSLGCHWPCSIPEWREIGFVKQTCFASHTTARTAHQALNPEYSRKGRTLPAWSHNLVNAYTHTWIRTRCRGKQRQWAARKSKSKPGRSFSKGPMPMMGLGRFWAFSRGSRTRDRL